MNPDISVIVLTYNQQDTIARALDSILAQRLRGRAMEIVVSDDASTDSTRRICAAYAARFPDTIRLLPPHPNLGVVDNYFHALSACRGRYIADCSGDDAWCDPLKLTRQADMLDANPSAVIVHTPWIECGPRSARTVTPIITAPFAHGRALISPLLRHLPAIHLSTALLRADTARQALASPDRALVHDPRLGCEDMPLLCALLARGDVAFIDTPSLLYTVNSGHSITSDAMRRRQARYYTRTLRATIRLARRYGVSLWSLRRYIATRALHILRLSV